MAVTADIDGIDLVIQSRELTPDDEEAFRQAIEECRKRCNVAEYSAEIKRILEEGRAIQEQRARSNKVDLPEKT
jgi:deoxyribose-phosphate aldolase